MVLRCLGLLICLWASTGARAGGTQESQLLPRDACTIVLPVAVAATPDPLRTFLAEREPELLRLALAFPQDQAFEAGEHPLHVLLDAGQPAELVGPPESQSAFPRSETDALRLYARLRVADGGRLPWVAQLAFEQVEQGFQAADNQKLLTAAAAVLRLSTEAALPFNTSLERVRAGTLNAESAGGASVLLPEDLLLSGRIHVGLVRRLRPRLEHEVRVWPGRARLVADPLEEVFLTLRRAHAVVPRLNALDQQVRQELSIDGTASFAERSEAYYLLLSEDGGPLIRERLEDAALLAANLWGSAWHRAGSPAVPFAEQAVSAPAASDSAAEPAPADEPVEELVGSRNSTVFHRASCPHARRIRPENRVTFPSAETAEAAGRKPCRSCKPSDR